MSGGLHVKWRSCIRCQSSFLPDLDGDLATYGVPKEVAPGHFIYAVCASCQADEVQAIWTEEMSHGS